MGCALLIEFLLSENKLRPSSPPLRGRASPQGEAMKLLTIFAKENFAGEIFSRQGEGYISKAIILISNDLLQSVTKHPVGALRNGQCPPPGGNLEKSRVEKKRVLNQI